MYECFIMIYMQLAPMAISVFKISFQSERIYIESSAIEWPEYDFNTHTHCSKVHDSIEKVNIMASLWKNEIHAQSTTMQKNLSAMNAPKMNPVLYLVKDFKLIG